VATRAPTLDAWRARRIILHLGSAGTPPEDGIEHFTVGLDNILRLLEDEYFTFLRDGLSTFKLVVGTYGGGKTHFLLNVRNLAWRHGAAVAYLTLNPAESPFDKLELVYRRITDSLQGPLTVQGQAPERGLEAFLRAWHREERRRVVEALEGGRLPEDWTEAVLKGLAGLESSSFRNALATALRALEWGDEERFQQAVQYLKGEGGEREFLKSARVFEPIDRSTAFRSIRSLAQFVRRAGFSGLVLLMDEAERMVSLASSRNQRTAVDNLRQFIDECGGSAIEGVFLFYAVPREDLLFGAGGGAVYEALRQRVRGTFKDVNPTGVKIDLEHLGVAASRFLNDLGRKLAEVYQTAYEVRLEPSAVDSMLEVFVKKAYELRYGDEGYRRLFVKAFIQGLQRLKRAPAAPFTDEELAAIFAGQAAPTPKADQREF
jgi:hypothetical protein